jgi:GNAT superfamily N-acetyltransferase
VTSPHTWSVERASPAHAELLADFAARSFRDAFGALNDPADVDAYCASAFTPAAQQREIADPTMTTFLARAHDELIGYAQLQDEEPPPGVGQVPAILLRRIYVDQGWLGTGVAQALMQAIAVEAEARAARTLWLTVWERNPRAIRFYSGLGMRIVGEADFLLGSERQLDLVMAIPVAQLLGALTERVGEKPVV